MKKKMLVIFGMTAFLLSGCMGKEETTQTEQVKVSEMMEMQEIFVTETETVENTENLTDESLNSEETEMVHSQNAISGGSNEETAKEKAMPTNETELEETDRSYIQSTEYVENPDNLPVLTGNETEEGLYWDSEWQHETYVEFGPDGEVYFDKYGNAYSCPVDAEGNLIIE